MQDATHTYDRKSRCRVFGLDCEDAMVWDGSEWTPGGEYVKRIKLTNVTTGTVHFTYRVPRNKVFFMTFPEKNVLSAGNHAYIEVRFRPIAHVAIEDQLEVVADAGSFFIPVVARLPTLSVAVTPEIMFDAVPVGEVTTHSITMVNNGQLHADFRWDVPEPFTIEPQEGHIAAGTTQTFHVSILPRHASVFSATATVDFLNGAQVSQVALRAISKYQFITSDTTYADFGTILYARRNGEDSVAQESRIRIVNEGSVRATVSVEPVDTTIIHQFTMLPYSVLIHPGSYHDFRVRYTPSAAGTTATEYFRFFTPGGNSIQVTARGRAEGPRLTIAKKERVGAPPTKRPASIQFGDIEVGKSLSHVVVITNHSTVAAKYELLSSPDGMFKVSEPAGVVAAQLSKQVVITFAPLVAGNFYRRLSCLVEDGNPCFVDVMGTSYDDTKRPFPLRQRHIDAYRLRSPALKLAPLDAVLAAVKEYGHASDSEQQAAEAEWQLSHLPAKSGDRTRAANAIYRELFNSYTDPSSPVSVLCDYVDFGHVSRVRLPEKQVITVCNNSSTKMAIQWIIPPSRYSNTTVAASKDATSFPGFSDNTLKDWIVTPETADIDPGQRAEFKIAFRPTVDDANYCQDLEIFAAPKLNRSFRLVDEESFVPTMCIPIKALGTTYRHPSSFIPRIATSFGGVAAEQTLRLPSATVGESVFYTFGLHNDSDVVTSFEFEGDASNTLSFVPERGVVPASGFALITVRFSPVFARVYTTGVNVRLNGLPDQQIHLRVVASGSVPKLTVEEGTALYIKPTSVGSSTTRRCYLRNVSRVPAKFVWHNTAATGLSEFEVTPSSGDIDANGRVAITVRYTPSQQGHVAGTLLCDCLFTTGSDNAANFGSLHGVATTGITDIPVIVDDAPRTSVHTLGLVVHTDGITGGLLFSDPSIDVGAVKMGERKTYTFTLTNASDASLSFQMGAITQQFVSEITPEAVSHRKNVILDEHYVQLKTQRIAAQQQQQHLAAASSSTRERFVRTVAVTDDAADELVCFEPAQGNIAPRSQLKVSVHFSPSAAGLYCIRSYVVVNPAHSGAVTVLTSKFAAINAALEAEALENDPALVDWHSFPLNKSNEWCELFVHAGYPTFMVEQAVKMSSREAFAACFPGHMSGYHNNYTPPSLSSLSDEARSRINAEARVPPRDLWLRPLDQSSPAFLPEPINHGGWAFEWQNSVTSPLLSLGSTLWSQMSLTGFNEYMAKPPTQAEHLLLYFDEERCAKLSEFLVEFDPAPLGSPPSTVWWMLRNPTRLPVDVVLEFEGILRTDPEPWVDVPEPEGDAAVQQMNLQRKIFDVQPPALHLGPGECAAVRLHYAHSQVTGVNPKYMRMLVRAKNGRGCVVRLAGRTFPPNSPCLYVPTSSKRLQLAPVMVGARQPPVQPIYIANLSRVKAKYFLDEFTMGELSYTQHGCRIFEVMNPTGVIEPGRDLVLHVRFRPLEPKEYQLRVRVCYESSEYTDADCEISSHSVDCLLNGWGYADTTAASELQAIHLLPCEPYLMPGVSAQIAENKKNALPSILQSASWGASPTQELVADAFYRLAGLDTLTASVSTFFNPLDVLTSVIDQAGAKNVEHMLLMLAEEQVDAPIVLFSGPDATTAANSLKHLVACIDTVQKLGSQQIENTTTNESARTHTAAASRIVPSSDNMKAIRGLLALMQRLWRVPGLWARLCRPGVAPAVFAGATSPFAPIYRIPIVDAPETMALLSSESVRFGYVPCGAITHALVVLRNTRPSPDSAPFSETMNEGVIHFHWTDIPAAYDGKHVVIHPKQGVLRPGESAAIRITLTAPPTPRILSALGSCRITVDPSEYKHRCESTLTAILRHRDLMRRQKHKMTPGTDAVHVSVAEKTTFSRTVHLHEAKMETALRQTRRKLLSSSTNNPAAHRRLAEQSQTLYSELTSQYGDDGRALYAKQAKKTTKSAWKPVSEVLAAVLKGDMSIDESILLLEAAEDDAKDYTEIRADINAIDLPPIPSITLPISITATVCPKAEFETMFSKQHLSAFVFPEGESTLQGLVSDGDAVRLASHSAAFDGFVKDLLSEVLSEVAAEVHLPSLSNVIASGTIAYTPNVKKDAATAPSVPTFEELRKTALPGSMNGVHLQANAVPVAIGAMSHGETKSVQLGNVVLDNRLPAARQQDFDLSKHLEVSRLIRTSNECRDVCARLVESTILSVMRDMLAGELAPSAVPSVVGFLNLEPADGDVAGKSLYEQDDVPPGTDDEIFRNRPEPEYKVGFDAEDE